MRDARGALQATLSMLSQAGHRDVAVASVARRFQLEAGTFSLLLRQNHVESVIHLAEYLERQWRSALLPPQRRPGYHAPAKCSSPPCLLTSHWQHSAAVQNKVDVDKLQRVLQPSSKADCAVSVRETHRKGGRILSKPLRSPSRYPSPLSRRFLCPLLRKRTRRVRPSRYKRVAVFPPASTRRLSRTELHLLSPHGLLGHLHQGILPLLRDRNAHHCVCNLVRWSRDPEQVDQPSTSRSLPVGRQDMAMSSSSEAAACLFLPPP